MREMEECKQVVEILSVHEGWWGQVRSKPFWNSQIIESIDSMLVLLLIDAHMDCEILGMEIKQNGLLSESKISMGLTDNIFNVIVDALLQIKSARVDLFSKFSYVLKSSHSLFEFEV